jgi:hypothetical protein
MQPSSVSYTSLIGIDIDRDSPLTRICARAATASNSLHDIRATTMHETPRANRRERRRAEEREFKQEPDSPLLGQFSGSWAGAVSAEDHGSFLDSSGVVETLIQQLSATTLEDRSTRSAPALPESYQAWRRRENNTAQRGAPVGRGKEYGRLGNGAVRRSHPAAGALLESEPVVRELRKRPVLRRFDNPRPLRADVGNASAKSHDARR